MHAKVAAINDAAARSGGEAVDLDAAENQCAAIIHAHRGALHGRTVVHEEAGHLE